MPPATSPEGPIDLVRPPTHPRRIIYLGTPEMAVAPLEALVSAGFEVVLVVSGPDKRRGRRGPATPTPVKAAALRLSLPVTDDLDDIARTDAELGVVVAYGKILRRPVLEAVALINLHFSLLPRWRGAAPVERALLAGDDRTGVCVMVVEEGLDTGGVYAATELPIDPTSTAHGLGTQLAEAASALLVTTLEAGLGEPAPQVGEPTYAAKITPDDLRLDWDRPAVELDRIVRVGGAWTSFRSRRFKAVAARPWPTEAGSGTPGQLHDDRVTCGEGTLELVSVQPEGKAPMAFSAWANGAHPEPGAVLGAERAS